MLSVSDLLKKTWTLYREHIQILTGLIAWLLIPHVLILLLEMISSPVVEVVIGILMLGNFFLNLWITTTVLLLLPKIIKKQPYVLKELFTQSLRILPSLLLVELLLMAVVLGGFILLLIPGLLFLVWFAFAQFAVLFENKRGIKALIASRELTRKRFWSIAWRLFGGPALIFFFYLTLTAILTILFSGMLTFTLENVPVWADVISSILELFFVPFFLIYSFLLYQEAKDTAVISKK